MKRPKAVVVAGWEARNRQHLMGWKHCLAGCRCNGCFQAALDRLSKFSEGVTNVCRTHFGVND